MTDESAPRPNPRANPNRVPIMTPLKRRFVDEYLIDLNATQAARRAGYVGNRVNITAQDLLKEQIVIDHIKERMDARAARTEITQDEVLRRWASIARANPNDLSQLRRCCCRHCWGEGHAYQWIDEAEFIRAWQKAKVESDDPALADCPVPAEMLLPDNVGGYGFNRRREPHEECPECGGEGFEQVFLPDTRGLTGEALALYAGVKKTRDGIEVMQHSQPKADEMVAKHLGMFVDRHEVSGKDGAPLIQIYLPDNGRNDTSAASGGSGEVPRDTS